MSISAADRRFIHERAGGLCEYCPMAGTWEPFFVYHVEHVIARQHGGGNQLDNLAFACHHCNLHKGPNVASVDPVGGTVSPLYHPREQNWEEHFRIESGYVQGLTGVGRATAFLLRMNADHRVELRLENSHPYH